MNLDFFRKLNHPFNVKFYGAALIREEDWLRVTLVMELFKENLMGRIFQNQDDIPSLSLIPGAAISLIRWARDIAHTLEFIHIQGIVHRVSIWKKSW